MKRKKETINHPSHYKEGNFEVIDIIEAFKLSFHLGNATKYILRAGRKTTDDLEDIKKAIWYLNRHVELKSKKQKQNHV